MAVGNDLKAVFISSPFPQAMQDIPYVGKILFGNSIFFYLGVVLAIVMHLFLNKSRTGLQLRSVGESPATADAAGINVSRYRYLGAIIGGGISAVGGMVYITTIAGCVWNHEGLSGVGWLAVALVIFLPVASSVRHLGLCAVRRSDDPVPASDDSLHPHAAV